MRGTSRTPAGVEAIAADGIEPARANPDRAGSVVELVDDVAVVIWALGSATGTAAEVAAVNGPRLERVLEHLVDTPVRGFVYEGAGSVPEQALAAGAAAVREAGERWRIPVSVVSTPPEPHDRWVGDTAGAVRAVLGL